MRLPRSVVAIVLTLAPFGGCGKQLESEGETSGALTADERPAAAPILLDGSSTVYPIATAAAAAFRQQHAAPVTVGISGTGGGFKKFCRGETAVNVASRPITASELASCREAHVRFIELPVAFDGLSVVVHPSNQWATSMTVAELKRLWQPEAQGVVTKWSQVRSGWPDQPIHLFGAGVDSGTYDYFTAAIVGQEHASRTDFRSSENDDELVRDVAADPLSLGFFGYAYYQENRARLKLLAIDDEVDRNGKGAFQPSFETVTTGKYQPLSRPLFVYVSKTASDRQDVAAFIELWLGKGAAMASEHGYIPLPGQGYELALHRFHSGIVGSLFRGSGSKIGVSAKDVSPDPQAQ